MRTTINSPVFVREKRRSSRNGYNANIKNGKKFSRVAADNVCRIEDEVDDLEEELRNKHIERLSSGLCKPSNGVVFLDILSNLERMSDHANNLADCVLAEIKEKK